MTFDPSKPITPTNNTAEPEIVTPAVVPDPAPVARPEPIHFTPEQQAKVDQIIRESHGRIAGDLRKELADARARQAEAEAQRDRAVAAALPTAGPDEKLAVELDQTKRENSELRAQMRTREREAAIREAAQRAHFIDPDDALLHVKVADDASAADIAKAVDDFANNERHWHLIKSTIPGGSGSTQDPGYRTPALRVEDYYGRSARPGAAESLNAMSRSNPAAYRSLRDQAKKLRLI